MRNYNTYEVALRSLIAIKRKINIVAVGANDGKTNDPIYDFVMSRASATNILLIEPNKLLIPHLKSNYSSHPSHQIANCAIGREGTLTLYAVKREFWDLFQPFYAKGWPSYRAATGITSAIKSHLEKALTDQDIDPDSAIDVLNIPAKELKTLLQELNWPTPIDVLQIDAEGYDDVVIFNSNLCDTRPKLIYFESHNLPEEDYKALIHYLTERRYKAHKLGRDTLAIDSQVNTTCILLNLTIYLHSSVRSICKILKKPSVVMKGLLGKHRK
ncbi:FkbM family methyltransferase [Ectothiorhodospira variabilis]|uniref:FkbM family methyltransferase n=1 Tax=Ectothiorhodospira variabilis TaxID=505694 RepID=UPI001EFBFA86|nr:FkbM family methyltransferase [Ectothiorhodospira variabilis]MCG5497539.1 FkbM family methyltransferase [Ectothiorhodospira variabilis]